MVTIEGIKVPESYSDIMISTYYKYKEYVKDITEDTNNIAFSCNTINILCGVPLNDIKNLKIETIKNIMSKLDFLKNAPKINHILNVYQIGDYTYKLVSTENITAGQYTTSQELSRSGHEENIARVAACFLTRVDEVWNDKSFERDCLYFLDHMSIQDCQTIVSFFLNFMKEFTYYSQEYLREEIENQMNQMKYQLRTTVSVPDGVG
jgi:hypothetical protein